MLLRALVPDAMDGDRDTTGEDNISDKSSTAAAIGRWSDAVSTFLVRNCADIYTGIIHFSVARYIPPVVVALPWVVVVAPVLVTVLLVGAC